MRDAVYTEDLALLANLPTQAESRLYSLEQAKRAIDLYMNANVLELVDKFTYLGSNISSTESDANIC